MCSVGGCGCRSCVVSRIQIIIPRQRFISSSTFATSLTFVRTSSHPLYRMSTVKANQSGVSDIRRQSPYYRTAMAKANEKCMQNADTNFLETKIGFKNFLEQWHQGIIVRQLKMLCISCDISSAMNAIACRASCM